MLEARFDAHCHIINPAFPLQENRGFLPAPFLVEDYLARARPLGITGGVVVSGSFQAYDQCYLTAALDELGPAFVGVTQVPLATPGAELKRLHEHHVRGVRFNLYRLGMQQHQALVDFAQRVYQLLGWHIELYVDAAELDDLGETLASLPAVAIDHLGLSAAGLPLLKQLMQAGVRVKASGFGRVDFPVEAVLPELYAANPEALMFGTDLPSTRAPRPFAATDIDLIESVLDAEGAERVLWHNARAFYRLA